MGRRHSIAARKASWDAKKSQAYAKIGKIIQIAAKKGADPKMNPSLDLALSKAKQYNLPREVVEKAILKWSGQLEGENLGLVVSHRDDEPIARRLLGELQASSFRVLWSIQT